MILTNSGVNPINGRFMASLGAILEEGALFAVSNTMFRISYTAGDGNDIELRGSRIGRGFILSLR